MRYPYLAAIGLAVAALGASSAASAAPASNLVYGPLWPANAGAALVAFRAAALPAAPRLASFGQAFEQGFLPAGQGLAMAGAPVQVDVKNRWPDGSVKFAVLTVMTPALDAGQTIVETLRAAAPAAGPAVGMGGFGPGAVALSLTVRRPDGSSVVKTFDAATLLAGSATPWLSGPLVSEARVDAPVTGALHATFDLRAYADKTLSVDVTLANDLIFAAGGADVTYDATLTVNGATRTLPRLHQWGFQTIHLLMRTDAAAPIDVLHDMASLERTGLAPRYELDLGIRPYTLTHDAPRNPALCVPLGSCGITPYMPTTGARADIGPQPKWVALALILQTPATLAYLFEQADAAGSVPWHAEEAPGVPALLTDHPRLWIDPRAVQQQNDEAPNFDITASVQGSGIHPDTSHQPDLSYVPYLLTGRHAYLDDLNAQAGYDVARIEPTATQRTPATPYLILGDSQIRGVAWSMREFSEAAAINPDGSKLAAYFTAILLQNLQGIVTNAARSPFPGVVSNTSLNALGAFPPWQEDFLATIVGRAAQLGFTAPANAALAAMAPFEEGRFLQSPTVFNPYDGANYALTIGTLAPSWANLSRASAAAGDLSPAVKPWLRSGSDYELGAAAALSFFPSPTARTWLLTHATNVPSYYLNMDPTWAIVPAP